MCFCHEMSNVFGILRAVSTGTLSAVTVPSPGLYMVPGTTWYSTPI